MAEPTPAMQYEPMPQWEPNREALPPAPEPPEDLPAPADDAAVDRQATALVPIAQNPLRCPPRRRPTTACSSDGWRPRQRR
jgi:hypothetical protein